MSVWVIGSIAYLAMLLFGWALARVASPPGPGDPSPRPALENPDRAMVMSAGMREASDTGV
jgi:hypothetical protein